MEKPNFKPLILLDAGHGGLDEMGIYRTAGKKQEFWSRKYGTKTINEGVLNRAVVYLLSFKLDLIGIDNYIVSESSLDTALKNRYGEVNNILVDRPNALLISIHHNWFNNPRVQGTEFFTYDEKTRRKNGDLRKDYSASLVAAENFIGELVGNHWYGKYKDGGRKLRVDLDRSVNGVWPMCKKENFGILRESKCPAILSEWGFMSNKSEFDSMSSDEGITEQANFWVSAVRNIIASKILTENKPV